MTDFNPRTHTLPGYPGYFSGVRSFQALEVPSAPRSETLTFTAALTPAQLIRPTLREKPTLASIPPQMEGTHSRQIVTVTMSSRLTSAVAISPFTLSRATTNCTRGTRTTLRVSMAGHGPSPNGKPSVRGRRRAGSSTPTHSAPPAEI